MSNSLSMDIAVDVSPEVVVRAIIDVPKWWTKDFEGSNGQAGDEFVICHPGSHYSKHARCAEGWTLVVKEQLFRYITEGVAI